MELTLRPWAMRDANELRPLLDDPQVRTWTRALAPRDWIRSQAVDGRHGFAVVRDGAIAGHVALKMPRPFEWEIGYWIATHARRQGLASWAVDEATRWGFAQFAMTDVALIHDVDNVGSCGLARRCGYLLAGELPPSQGYPRPGHRHVRRLA